MSLTIHGKVNLDGSGWEKGVRRIEASATHMAGHVSGHLKGMIAGAFGVAAIEQAVHKTIEYGEKVVDMSRRVGVGIEALQEFGYAAKMTGADLEQLQSFIENLNKNRFDPMKAGAWKTLGISQADLKSLNVEDMLMKMSLHVRTMSSQELSGPIRSVGGRAGDAMIGMLKDDLEELRHQAERLGLVMKSEAALTLKDLADQMHVLSQVIIIGLAPAIISLMEIAVAFINKIRASG